jgi:integrative and conjugative element protein (TIGR02256 family)
MTTAWIRISVQCDLERAAQHALPDETGGLLVGYRADNDEVVIQELVGPGPEARHSPVRFVPDHAWQCQRLDEIYRKSNGRLVYIGDWHTHPHGVPEMSTLDRRTLRNIARHPGIGLGLPVMLIGGNANGTWSWKVHEYRSSSLFGLRVVTEQLQVRAFD